MTLQELLKIQSFPSQCNQSIHNLTLDSRQVLPGDVFLALAGTQTHGQRYIDAALQRGAIAVLKEAPSAPVEWLTNQIPCISIPNLTQQVGILAARFYHDPSHDMTVIGVTGTNGKTSVSHFVAQILDIFNPCGLIGTLGYGRYQALALAQHTTPNAIVLQALFAQFREQAIRQVVMEVSSHALVQGRVNGIAFDCAVFTNLTRDHLDYHQTMTAYGEAKQLLFHLPNLKTAILNADDAFSQQILARLPTAVTPITYSLRQSTASVYATIKKINLEGYQLVVHTPWETGEFAVPLLGEFNVSNLLAALTVLLTHGVSLTQMIPHLSTLQAVAGRMERLDYADGRTAVIDYAHTPDALQKVLQALRQHCCGKLWCVFGCGGNRDPGKRPLMGEVAQRFADSIVLTDDNPRFEEADAIIADIIRGCPSPTAVIRDRKQAIHYALQNAQSGDIVLIAGKGHEDYQIIGDKRLAFSDKEVALQVGKMLNQRN
jgi:UDP-N-acetylmuramoyl-L-alanyl-D-glutamate--2,6-diaminopimelate ligase